MVVTVAYGIQFGTCFSGEWSGDKKLTQISLGVLSLGTPTSLTSPPNVLGRINKLTG